MEDTVKVELQLPQGEAMFCVFDGHGGKEVAQFCQQEVVPTLQALDSYQSKDYESALRECFVSLDKQMGSPEGQGKIVAISKALQEEMRSSGQEFTGGDASDEVLAKIP